MDLPKSIVKEFAKQAVEKKPTVDKPNQLVGTVQVEDGQTFVYLDGSNGSKTPVSETVVYQSGDRVLVSIQNRKATIIGNYTGPSINQALDNVIVEYALSSNSVSFIAWPGEKGEWNTIAPEKEDGSYMWQRTTKISTNPLVNPEISLTCIQGSDGENGYTPYIGSNGNWWINGVDTGYSAEGDDGHSPYVDTTTNTWWEWDADIGGYHDTGIVPQGPGVFKSIVFKRFSSQPSTPTGGSYLSPVPSGWSDGIPSGTEQIWISTRVFTSDGEPPQTSEWTTPQKASDTADIDFEYSWIVTNPGNPSDNPDNWSNAATENSIWMAVRKKSIGTWSSWEISKIKGEMSAEQLAQLNQASEDASQAKSDVANLDIGGRNLLLNSGFKDNSDGWDYPAYISGHVVKDRRKCAHINHSELNRTKFARQSILGKLEPNTQYIMSGWVFTENVVKGTTNFICIFYHDGEYNNNGTTGWYGYGKKDIPINAGKWTHLEWTFTTDSKNIVNATSSYVYVYTRDMTGDIYFCDLKLEKGNKATDWTPAPEDVDNNIKDSIDNLEIGGRNLVTNSVNLSDFSIESSTYTTRTITDDYCIINRLVNANKPSTHYGIYKDIPVTAGEEYTVSCTVKEITGRMRLGLGHDTSQWTGLGVWNLSVGRFSRTVTAPSNATFIRIYIAGNDGVNGGSVTVSNIKLEKGNKATDWTPAPEDVDAGIANAAKTATNYIHSDTTNGLVVNNNQNVGVGYDIQLKADGSNTGMNIRQDGEILASFLQNSVSLGKNSINSRVGMCGDKGGVSASFGYYIDSVTSINGEPGSTLSFDFNETTFKNKVGQTTGFYEFIYTSADGWELFDPVHDTTSKVTLSQYGITMKTPTSSLNDHAQITIKYVLDGSVKFYNADISNPVRKLELEMAENPSSSESDYANITIERQSGTYASGDGKEHSIITMMTLHEFANVATLQLFDDEISLNAARLYLTSSYGDGSIQLDGDTNINGNLIVQGDNLVSKIQAMLCAAYPETLTVKAGTFTDNGCGASLVGNSLYLYLNAKAKAAITAGNISNQTMLTITFTDSRISVLYSVSTSGGASGPNSQMQFTGASSGGQHTITVTLAAIAQNIAKGGVINAHVSIPCVLNWDAY